MQTMTKDELESKHIAELHALAADAGVERYRMLRREELIERLSGEAAAGAAGDGDGAATESRKRSGGEDEARSGGRRRRRRGSGRRGAGEGGDRRPARDESGPEPEDGEAQRISGELEIGADGNGIVREEGREAQVSAAQIKRCELRAGDLVEGPVRGGRREGRVSLARVESVNGGDPEVGRGPGFEQLTPVTPTRRIPLEIPADDVLARAADILAPLAFGQRVLVRAEPRSGRSTLLRGMARAVMAAGDSPPVSVLLIDERPEEATEWQRQVPGAELTAAPADMHPSEQVRLAELALARAKRRAERGEDAVLVIDSLTRLAVACGDAFAVKPFFGAGRELAEEGAGSLTVIAAALSGDGDGSEALQAVATTESTSLELSAELAAEGIVPALLATRPSVAGEELLRSEAELAAARKLRSELRMLPAEQAARTLAERIAATGSNAELLG